MGHRKLSGLVAVADFIGLAVNKNLPQRAVFTLGHQSHNLLLVVVINKGFHRLNRGKHRLPAK